MTLEILQRYNSEIRGFYNYFGIGVNCAKQMNNFGYIIWNTACIRLLPQNIVARLQRYVANTRKDGIFTVSYQGKKGNTIEAKFYNGGFKRLKAIKRTVEFQPLPNFIMHTSTTSLMDRLKAQKCELWGNRQTRNASCKKTQRTQRERALGKRMMIA